MTFNPKDCILSNKFLDLCCRCQLKYIIVSHKLAIMFLYFLLLPNSEIAVGASPATSSTNSIKVASNSTCSYSSGIQAITNLVSTNGKISAWFKQSHVEFGAIFKTLAPETVEVMSQGFNTLISHSGLPLQLPLEKPLRLYTMVWQQTISPLLNPDFNFTSPVQKAQTNINNVSLIFISGGKPITIHADSRYQVPEILTKSGTKAIAAVDGTFFSLKFLTSNTMIGPVLSQVSNKFVPGNNGENKKLAGRPLVLISSRAVNFIPFNPAKHNTLQGIQTEMPDVSDAFVAGAWLVKNGQPLPRNSYKSLYGADVARHRAFWGINKAGIPTIGVSTKPVDSANLGIILTKAGLKDVVMLDSGASTSLAYQGVSLVGYTPRPVPHVVALVPPESSSAGDCVLASQSD